MGLKQKIKDIKKAIVNAVMRPSDLTDNDIHVDVVEIGGTDPKISGDKIIIGLSNNVPSGLTTALAEFFAARSLDPILSKGENLLSYMNPNINAPDSILMPEDMLDRLHAITQEPSFAVNFRLPPHDVLSAIQKPTGESKVKLTISGPDLGIEAYTESTKAMMVGFDISVEDAENGKRTVTIQDSHQATGAVAAYNDRVERIGMIAQIVVNAISSGKRHLGILGDEAEAHAIRQIIRNTENLMIRRMGGTERGERGEHG